MKTFIVTYDFSVYKPSSLNIYEQQKSFKAEVKATDKTEARTIFMKEYNKNHFYFQFTEVTK